MCRCPNLRSSLSSTPVNFYVQSQREFLAVAMASLGPFPHQPRPFRGLCVVQIHKAHNHVVPPKIPTCPSWGPFVEPVVAAPPQALGFK